VGLLEPSAPHCPLRLRSVVSHLLSRPLRAAGLTVGIEPNVNARLAYGYYLAVTIHFLAVLFHCLIYFQISTIVMQMMEITARR
jgi:hypothetical protein